MVALTFPDGARRDYPARHHRSRHRQGHFAVAGQAHGGDGARRRARRPRRPDRARRQDRVRLARRSARAGADPARLRPCAGRGGAGAVARHPGHHRPGDRERLLLRLRPQPAVHAGGLRRRSRRRCARSSRATNPSPRRSGRATRPSSVFRDKGEMFKVELVDAIPEDQQLKIYKQGDWFDLCRGPHMTSTGKIGNAFKLMKVAGAYWRGDSATADAVAHLRHRVGQAGGARRLSQAAGGGREARPPQARPRDGPVPFPGGRARHGVLARQGLDHLPGDRRLYAPPPARATTARSTRRSFSTSRCGRPPATGNGSARTCSWRRRPATRPRTSASSRSSR